MFDMDGNEKQSDEMKVMNAGIYASWMYLLPGFLLVCAAAVKLVSGVWLILAFLLGLGLTIVGSNKHFKAANEEKKKIETNKSQRELG